MRASRAIGRRERSKVRNMKTSAIHFVEYRQAPETQPALHCGECQWQESKHEYSADHD